MEEKYNQRLLSFVIPCFNAEQYVQLCLDSVFACNLEEADYEVLCVDDGSTDRTHDILKHNCELHGNLRVITHDANKGWGGPRNTGIKEAKGRYLWFVDSDDMVKSEVEVALRKAIRENLDVLCFNYDRVDVKGRLLSVQRVFRVVPMCDGYAFAKTAFQGGIVSHMGYVWRFLYKTEYLRSNYLCFPEGVCWEDTVFMPKSILEAERVAAIPEVLYSYRTNQESVSGVFSRIYPAYLIYDFAFCAGKDLLDFSQEVEDGELSSSFKDAAIHKYINGFAVHLFRTGRVERKRFYGILGEKHKETNSLKCHMTMLNRILIKPYVGPLLTGLLSFVYKKKHKRNGM